MDRVGSEKNCTGSDVSGNLRRRIPSSRGSRVWVLDEAASLIYQVDDAIIIN